MNEKKLRSEEYIDNDELENKQEWEPPRAKKCIKILLCLELHILRIKFKCILSKCMNSRNNAGSIQEEGHEIPRSPKLNLKNLN